MECAARPASQISIILCLTLLAFTACSTDADAPAAETTSVPPQITEEAIRGQLQVPDDASITIEDVTPVAGQLEDFGDRNLGAEGSQQALTDARADFKGFAGISPCDVIKPADLANWPGGVGKVSTQRNNVGELILGCVYTFAANGGSPGGRILVYFSDNKTNAGAQEAVQMMPETSGGSARLVNDWDAPAAFDPATGDFVWSKGQAFINLAIQHPAVRSEQEKWSRIIASRINARM